MNIKRNLLILYIFLNIIIIFFINFKNSNKVNINIFTWQTSNNSLGKIITYSYIAGLSFNVLLTLIINGNELKIKEENQQQEELFEESQSEESQSEDELNYKERPPERDIKESQPTISVNYRVIDNINDNKYIYDNNPESDIRINRNKIDEDWGEDDKGW